MMTFDARDLAALNAAILRGMIEVTELNRPKLCLGSQNDYFRQLLSVLRRNFSGSCSRCSRPETDKRGRCKHSKDFHAYLL